MREPKEERKKECIESHLTRFTFRRRSFRLNSLQFPVTQCGNFKPHHRTVPHTVCVFALSGQIRSDRIRGGSINLNVFILCTRFVDTFSTSRNQACACSLCRHVHVSTSSCTSTSSSGGHFASSRVISFGSH